MAIIRLLALISLLASLTFVARTEEGGHLDPNGRPNAIDGGGAMDPNGYSACIDPNG
jgi:hypothetical protein